MAKRLLPALVCVVLALPGAANAREQIRIVGSSTVFPFVAAAAEQFGHSGKYATPIVEVNGTGGGFKMFCDGIGERFPDMANASRPIKESEIQRCADHGVKQPVEFTIGYDGIVFANAIGGIRYPLTKRDVFLALSREVPKDGALVPNPYERWSEVNKALPDLPIEVYGPPPAEGTRDAFVELVMHEACKEFPEYKGQCGAVREDGKFVEVLGGNVMVQKLVNNPHSLGIFSYSFLDQNRSLVKANKVDGVEPTFEGIVSHRYGVARSLFVYIKREHLGQTPGLAEFVQFLMSDAATGEDGFLIVKGLLPLPRAEHETAKKAAGGLK